MELGVLAVFVFEKEELWEIMTGFHCNHILVDIKELIEINSRDNRCNKGMLLHNESFQIIIFGFRFISEWIECETFMFERVHADSLFKFWSTHFEQSKGVWQGNTVLWKCIMALNPFRDKFCSTDSFELFITPALKSWVTEIVFGGRMKTLVWNKSVN